MQTQTQKNQNKHKHKLKCFTKYLLGVGCYFHALKRNPYLSTSHVNPDNTVESGWTPTNAIDIPVRTVLYECVRRKPGVVSLVVLSLHVKNSENLKIVTLAYFKLHAYTVLFELRCLSNRGIPPDVGRE